MTDLVGPDGVFLEALNQYVDGHGAVIGNVHSREACEHRHCAIHNPSDHSMRSFKTHVRVPGPFDIKPMHMERICPHGVGHPDPDDMLHWVERGERSMGVHGCDGCCSSPIT